VLCLRGELSQTGNLKKLDLFQGVCLNLLVELGQATLWKQHLQTVELRILDPTPKALYNSTSTDSILTLSPMASC